MRIGTLQFTTNGRPATRAQIRKHVSEVRLLANGRMIMQLSGVQLLTMERFWGDAPRQSRGRVKVSRTGSDMDWLLPDPSIPLIIELSTTGIPMTCEVLP